MRKALLIIDMQKGSFTDATPRFDTQGVIKRINTLCATFRRKNLPVIFIQHDGAGTGEFEKNTWEWELLDTLEVEPTDTFIDKYANDVFYSSQLESLLAALKVTELVITGCATDFCVASTVQSALAKDFNIYVVADGHTTEERSNLKATQVIEHYNWVWQNMIPTKGKIVVEASKEINQKLLNH